MEKIYNTDTGNEMIAKINDNFGTSNTYTAQQCLDAFVAKMNEFAADLGCSSSTHFDNPSGMIEEGENHKVTANDYVRIVSAYAQENVLLAINNYKDYDVIVTHADNTSETVNIKAPYCQTTGDAASLTSQYNVLGGKGGSWTWSGQVITSTMAILAESNVKDGMLIAGYVRTTTNGANKYAMIKSLFDALEAGTATPSIANVTECAACYVPYNAWGNKNINYVGSSYNGANVIDPASTTKLLTCILACRYLPLDANVEVLASDLRAYSGITLLAGDKMNVREAIMACLYSSSNTMATTLGRVVGGMILREKDRMV